MYPVMMIIFNSFKKETAISTSTVFELPTAETFNGIIYNILESSSDNISITSFSTCI